MNNTNFESIEQAMNDRQRTAAKLYCEFLEKQIRTEFEDMLLQPSFEQIRQLAGKNATETELDNAAYEVMAAAKEAGFIYGYTYALERLRETLLIQ